jgi:macrolide transport system ATP-binding/permease protein
VRLFRFLRRKSELTEELESHLDMAIADRVARGQSPMEARNAVIREFGNLPMHPGTNGDGCDWKS